MSTRTLVITYESPEGKEATVEYSRPPSFYEEDEWFIFARGILSTREIEYNRILEIYTTEIVYSVFDRGMEALQDAT